MCPPPTTSTKRSSAQPRARRQRKRRRTADAWSTDPLRLARWVGSPPPGFAQFLSSFRGGAFMIRSLLIANRGEIACRIIRTARRLGVRTLAVYSDADRHALHVREADEPVHIGPSPARESYLVGERIIAAAKEAGAEAIHPGYGFVSENADFAEAVEAAGLVWVGPKAA